MVRLSVAMDTLVARLLSVCFIGSLICSFTTTLVCSAFHSLPQVVYFSQHASRSLPPSTKHRMDVIGEGFVLVVFWRFDGLDWYDLRWLYYSR